MTEDRRQQVIVGGLVISGLVLLFGGFLVWLLLAGSGALQATQGDFRAVSIAPMGIGISVIGGMLATAGVIVGWRFALVDDSKKPMRALGRTWVVARFASDLKGNTVFSYELHDPEHLEWMVQLRTEANEILEFKAAPEVWERCGEGFEGQAWAQGRRLTRFEPNVGTGGEIPVDPYVR